MKHKKILCPFISLIFSAILISYAFPLSLNVSSIRAYPVPFNPNKHNSLIIDSFPGGANSIKIEIFDINGDKVFSRNFSSPLNVLWNGRNEKGRVVRPGLYIIKIIVEETGSGAYGKKIIRILVNS